MEDVRAEREVGFQQVTQEFEIWSDTGSKRDSSRGLVEGKQHVRADEGFEVELKALVKIQDLGIGMAHLDRPERGVETLPCSSPVKI